MKVTTRACDICCAHIQDGGHLRVFFPPRDIPIEILPVTPVRKQGRGRTLDLCPTCRLSLLETALRQLREAP